MHGFLADAGSLRDLISFLVWKFVLRRGEGVTTLGTFIKKARDSDNALASEIVSEAKDRGWLKILSTLRDRIVHVAPVGGQSDLHSFKIRAKVFKNGDNLYYLHYPIMSSNFDIYSPREELNRSSDDFISAIRDYNQYLDSSIDGLYYCWNVLDNLIDLISRVRLACEFRQESVVITDRDIIEIKEL